MALSFNGSSSKLEWAGALASAFPFTIFGWVKPTSASTSHMAFGSGSSGFELAAFLDGANKAKAFTNAGGSTFAASANALTTIWQPVMCVFTSAGARTIYYGNGAPVSSSTTNNAFVAAHTRFVVGTRPQADGQWFNGDIAHVAAWSTALTQANFDALAAGAAPNTVASASLIEYWSLATQAATQTGVNGRVLTATSISQAATEPIGTAAATALTLTGPTTGTVGTASTNFTVAANGSLSANVTVTPSSGGGGGTFSPATLTLTSAATSGTFTYTATTTGAKTISVTNSGSLANPSAVTFTASAAGDTTPPTLTGAITIGTVTSTSITMSWPAGADNVAVTSYEVSKDSGATWIDTSGTGLSYIFTGLAASTSYGLRVRAKDAAGNVSTPALAATQSTSAAGGATLTSSALKNNTGALHLSAAFEAFVLNATTGALIVRKSGLTSHATTGVVTFNDAALTAATQYRVVWRRTDTGAQGLELLTAA